MTEHPSKYGAAKGFFGFAEAIAWVVVICGVGAAFFGATLGAEAFGEIGLLGAVPGAMFTMLGLLMAVVIQTSKAVVDTADATDQMLTLSREHLAMAAAQGKALHVLLNKPAAPAANVARPEAWQSIARAAEAVETGAASEPAPAGQQAIAETTADAIVDGSHDATRVGQIITGQRAERADSA